MADGNKIMWTLIDLLVYITLKKRVHILLKFNMFPFHSIKNHFLTSSMCTGLQLAYTTLMRLLSDGETLQSQKAGKDALFRSKVHFIEL